MFVLDNIPCKEMNFPQLQSLCLILMCLSVSQKDVQTTVMFLILWFSCEVWNAMMIFFFFLPKHNSVHRGLGRGSTGPGQIGESSGETLLVCISLFRHVAVLFLETLSPGTSILSAVFQVRGSAAVRSCESQVPSVNEKQQKHQKHKGTS